MQVIQGSRAFTACVCVSLVWVDLRAELFGEKPVEGLHSGCLRIECLPLSLAPAVHGAAGGVKLARGVAALTPPAECGTVYLAGLSPPTVLLSPLRRNSSQSAEEQATGDNSSERASIAAPNPPAVGVRSALGARVTSFLEIEPAERTRSCVWRTAGTTYSVWPLSAISTCFTTR